MSGTQVIKIKGKQQAAQTIDRKLTSPSLTNYPIRNPSRRRATIKRIQVTGRQGHQIPRLILTQQLRMIGQVAGQGQEHAHVRGHGHFRRGDQ